MILKLDEISIEPRIGRSGILIEQFSRTEGLYLSHFKTSAIFWSSILTILDMFFCFRYLIVSL